MPGCGIRTFAGQRRWPSSRTSVSVTCCPISVAWMLSCGSCAGGVWSVGLKGVSSSLGEKEALLMRILGKGWPQ